MGKEIKTVKKDRTTLWITIVIAVLIVGSLGLWWFTGSGVRDRSVEIVSTKNYKVDGTMFPYYQHMLYNETVNGYYNQLLSYGFDENMANQYVQSAIGNLTFKSFTGEAVDLLKRILIDCEAAKAEGIKLEADDKEAVEALLKQVENTVKEIEAQYKAQGMAYGGLSEYFGVEGVRKSDIKKAIELYALSAKYYEHFMKNALETATAEEIDKFVVENRDKFYITKYLSIELSVNSEDYTDDEEGLETAKALIEEYTDKLLEAKSINEFKTLMVEYIVKAEFDGFIEEIDAELLPEAEAVEAAKLEVIDNIVKLVVEEKTVEEKTASEGTFEYELLKVENDLKEVCESALTSSVQYYAEEHQHEEGEEVDHEDTPLTEEVKWLINESAKEGDTKEISVSDGTTKHGSKVYMVEKPLHLVDEITKNVGHILIKAESGKATEEETAAAKAKAEEILAQYKAGAKTEEAFEELGWANTEDSNVFYDNVVKDQMVAEFDSWLFDEARKEGDTDIVKTDFGFHVMLYRGEESYKDAVAKNGIAAEKYADFLEANEGKVKINDKAVAKYSE